MSLVNDLIPLVINILHFMNHIYVFYNKSNYRLTISAVEAQINLNKICKFIEKCHPVRGICQLKAVKVMFEVNKNLQVKEIHKTRRLRK